MNDIWSVFPYPTLQGSIITDGLLMEAHNDCISCPTRQCASDLKAVVGELKTCRYGLSYTPVDEHRVVVGVIDQHGDATSRARRRRRQEPQRRVDPRQMSSVVTKMRAFGPGVISDFKQLKRAALEDLSNLPELQEAVSVEMRKNLEKNVNETHDFLQLVNLIRGNAEVLLREKYPDMSVEDAADEAEVEGAIFYATRLIRTRMDSLAFINEANRALGNEENFRIHALIYQYVRIYGWQARQKNLDIQLGGTYALSRYNKRAMGALMQAILDNMVKYAPAGSRATVSFEEAAH